MLKPRNLYLCIHEENSDFRSKLIQAGFSENIFECKAADKVEFYIIKQDDSISGKRDYGNANIIYIGTDTSAVRRIIDNTCKSDKECCHTGWQYPGRWWPPCRRCSP